jgi:hypothetical protein
MSLEFQSPIRKPSEAIAALHRRFGAVVAALATWVGLNAVGFLRMGSGSFADYRQNMAHLRGPGRHQLPRSVEAHRPSPPLLVLISFTA